MNSVNVRHDVIKFYCLHLSRESGENNSKLRVVFIVLVSTTGFLQSVGSADVALI